jgi:alpha-beta hydrolase superfamily lysophospholipase
MKRKEFTSAGIGGLDLYAQGWLPEGSPKTVLVLAHGLGEHGGRYVALAQEFVGHGHAVYAVDHRGHGRSPGPRANIERFDHVVSDFCAFAGRAARQHPDAPLVLLGHSMGGAIALVAALRLQDSVRGVVLSAPALGVGEAIPPGRRLVAQLLSRIAPNVGLMRLTPAAVSRDPAVVRAYEADPLVHHGPIPARTLVELLEAMDRFPALAPKLRLPTLVLHGTADTLVPVAGVRATYQALDVRKRTVRYYEGLYHEVFNEPERAQVIADVLQWLERV